MHYRVSGLLLTVCGVVFAAADDAAGLISSPSSYQPLSPQQRWQMYLKKTYGIEAWARVAFVSAIRQWGDEPPEWQQGMTGYGRRYGTSFARNILRDSIEYGGGALIGEDPRYERCRCRGVLPRITHATVSSVLSRNREGNRTPAFARLTGIYAAPMISVAWYPERYTVLGDGMRWGTISVGFKAGFNVFREYWPDLRRALRR